jgi:hypothetical protein
MGNWFGTRWRSLVVVGVAVLVSGALVAGGVLAQTPPVTPTPTAEEKPAGKTRAEAARDAFLAKVATKLNVSQEQLTTAMRDAAKEMIDEAVQAGRISQAAADRMKQRIDQGGPIFPRGRHLGPGKLGRPGLALRWLHGGLRELADWLGMTPRELVGELRDGQSLAQVAQAKGKSRDELITFLTDAAKQRLDKAVANGRLTQEQADAALERFTQRVDNLVDRTRPAAPDSGDA